MVRFAASRRPRPWRLQARDRFWATACSRVGSRASVWSVLPGRQRLEGRAPSAYTAVQLPLAHQSATACRSLRHAESVSSRCRGDVRPVFRASMPMRAGRSRKIRRTRPPGKPVSRLWPHSAWLRIFDMRSLLGRGVRSALDEGPSRRSNYETPQPRRVSVDCAVSGETVEAVKPAICTP